MKNIIILIFSIIVFQANGQGPASINESKQTLKTYPFSDPNPVPNPESSFYPYFRFDGFALEAEQKEWTVVVLENDFIEVSIFPEIGGKVWGAIEKSTGEEFLYYNSVVKFRDIAMRGAWTSGGVEMNFGVIGHAPTCATPVDYKLQENDDGSVSCFVGAYELLTRTRWETEIKLESDKAYFTTTTRWHNPTPLIQPYYQWMNAAYQVKGDLEFCFPGSNWIGHDGRSHSWPIDDDGTDISFYKNNNFGGSKSNHVLGGISDYYAGYWHDLQFGSGHYAQYGDKLGMKVFQWAHSRSGGIWEDLLTDTDGQYVELQSGRLFNQAVANSTKTPFKHFGFEPYAMDVFEEYWFPILKTEGVAKANPHGILNVEKQADEQSIYFCPLQKTEANLSIFFGNELIEEIDLSLDVLQTWSKKIKVNPTEKPLKLILGANQLVYSEVKEDNISQRPMDAPMDFDWESTYGLYLDGLQWVYLNKYEQAEEKFQKCLAQDKYYAPALNQMSSLSYRKGNYEEGVKYASKSLSINTYDPEANFLFGLNHKKLGHLVEAHDGFSVASLTSSFRIASLVELSKLYYLKGDLLKAKSYAERIGNVHMINPEGAKLINLVNRNLGLIKSANHLKKSIASLDHFYEYELMLLGNGQDAQNAFIKTIGSELPQETFLEMALWYADLGSVEDAVRILELSPASAMVSLHLAYLLDKQGDTDKSKVILKEAFANSTSFTLPFRAESLSVLEWAAANVYHWKPKYLLSLLHRSFGNYDIALSYVEQCGLEPDEAAFYLAKSSLFENQPGYDAEDDLIKAHELAPDEWRTSSMLIEYYLSHNQTEKALQFASAGIAQFPSNNLLKYSYAEALIANQQYEDCKKALATTYILPSEGARYGRVTYRRACLMQAIELLEDGKIDAATSAIAEARLWPENLGVGKPFNVDERIENYLAAECLLAKRKKKQAAKLLDEVVAYNSARSPKYNSVDYLFLKSLRKLGREEEVTEFLEGWEKKAPDALMLEWTKKMLSGQNAEADVISSKIRTASGGAPWEPIVGDPEFEVVKSIGNLKN